jgi:hypothetical protein
MTDDGEDDDQQDDQAPTTTARSVTEAEITPQPPLPCQSEDIIMEDSILVSDN